MTPDESQLAALMLGDVLATRARVAEAEAELIEMGITRPSLSDIQNWMGASRKQRETLAIQWATFIALGDPDWKT